MSKKTNAEKVAELVNAGTPATIVFTSGTSRSYGTYGQEVVTAYALINDKRMYVGQALGGGYDLQCSAVGNLLYNLNPAAWEQLHSKGVLCYYKSGNTIIDGAGLDFMLRLLQKMGYLITNGYNKRNGKPIINIQKV